MAAYIPTPVYLSVRVIGNSVAKDLSKSVRSYRGQMNRDAQELGRAFTRGFNRGVDVNVFSRVSNGLRSMVPEAEAARKSFSSLVRTSYTLGTGLTLLVGGASSAISALGGLAGAAAGAASTAAVLGNGLVALGTGMLAVRLATSGVGQALSRLQQQQSRAATGATRTALQQVRDNQAREAALRRIEDAERSLARIVENNRERMAEANQAVMEAQNDLNAAIRAGREELQQLGFEAEDAAIAEQRAAIELEKARETLARVQDLPPNSRARREAELAFAEAELNYRKAKDANADLAAEQERLARTGVNGLDSVINARNRLADAEESRAKTAKDALEDEADALRNVAEARQDAANVQDRQDAADPGGAGATGAALKAWDEGLNEYQRKFALFLDGLRPKFQELELIASAAFLPRLQTAIETLMERAFPVVAVGIGLVAEAMGNAAIELANVITEGQNLDKLAAIFDSSATIIELFGVGLGNVYDILLSILTAAAPLAEQFFGFINDQMGQFAEHLNSDAGRTELIDFFGRASYTAQLFGDVLGNVFRGIGGVIDANIGPNTGASFLLEELVRVTNSWGTGEGLVQFFRDVSTNASQVFGALGDLLGILGRIGADQSIGEAFAAIREGAPFLENILQTAVDAAPSFGELVTTITEIVSALADTGAMQVFFDTLNGIFGVFRDFVSSPGVKGFLDFFGRIFAFFSAIGFVITPILFGLKVFTGIIMTVTGFIGALVSIQTAWTNITKLAAGAQKVLNMAMSANPIGIIVTAIAALVGVLIWFFTETDEGRKIWAEFTRFLGEAWENVTRWIGETLDNLGKFFSDTWNNIVGFVEGAFNFIVDLFLNWTIFGLIISNWDNIVAFFEDVWNNIMGFFDAAFKWIDTNIIQPFNTAWEEVGNFFRDVGLGMEIVWNAFKDALDRVWKWIDKNIFKPIRDAMAFVGFAFEVAGQMIEKAWNDMMNALDVVFQWIDQHIFEPIKTAVGFVQDAFENVAEGIAKAWEGIKKAAAAPINFVIDTVYNNGLRSFWNDIADNLNMKNLKLPRVPTIRFASGGVMPGYTPGRDVHRFYSPTGGILHLSGGEAIMRPEWTRAVGGPKAVERMNRAARGGRAYATGGVYGSGGGGVRRFASGGVLDFAGDILEGLAKIGQIIGDFFVDPQKAVKTHIIDAIIKPMTAGMGEGMFADLIGEVPVTIAGWIGESVKNLFGSSSDPNKPANALGWQAQWNIVKQVFPWATLNSSFRPGAITATGSKSYHGLGRAIDVTPSMAIFNYLASAFPNSRELIYSPAGSRQLQNGRRYNWGEPVRSMHFDHVHWAMAKGGTVYPTPDGTIVRVAEAGRPERVEPLDPNGLSERDKAMIELLAGENRGVTIYVTQLPNEDGEALAERISRIISRNMRRGATK